MLGVLRFMISQNLLDACFAQRQRLALVGLLQAIDQRLNLQLRDFLTQSFTEAGTEAVGQIVSIVRGVFFVSVNGRKNHAEG
ncbi:hypothetical protein D3C81_1537690 [compost metagenome]